MADANLTVSNHAELAKVLQVLEDGACSTREALELLLKVELPPVIEHFNNSQAPNVRRMAIMTACRLLEAAPGDKYAAGIVDIWAVKSAELHERPLTHAERTLVLLADSLAEGFAKPWH